MLKNIVAAPKCVIAQAHTAEESDSSLVFDNMKAKNSLGVAKVVNAHADTGVLSGSIVYYIEEGVYVTSVEGDDLIIMNEGNIMAIMPA